jgi:hypothetical protein
MVERKRNHYQEANANDGEAHPIDDELERRLRHATLRKRIIAAQGRVVAALGEQRQLYLRLEELVGVRQIDREEAMFNLGFEHGLVQGRADALGAILRRQGARGRALAVRLAQVASNAGFEPPRALAAFLEVAWAMALGPRKPPIRARRSARSAS